MASKLLHSLADNNPDLQQQIGCMTGIFQLFDRNHVLIGRRLSHKKLSPGNSHFNRNGFNGESNNAYNQQRATEMNTNKSVNEKQRISTESSRPSFSSLCSSSLSSSEFNKAAQPEATSFERIIFPETPSRNPVMNQASSFLHLGRQSLDLRDVVKDSMYREARGLSVKTTIKEELVSGSVKHRDSPRPLQLSKSVDRSYGAGISGKQNVPVDLNESLRVLSKLGEAPRYYNEAKELPRSSYEAKDGSWHSISKDAPRYSYDGREINHLSFESRDTFKSLSKLKELPRLSLDSREGSVRGSNSDSKASYLSKSFQNSGNSSNKIPNPPQSLGSQKRPPGVVAKLMGLETLPDSASASDSRLGSIKTGPVEDSDPFSRSLRGNDLNKPIQTSSNSPRRTFKDPNPDLIMKPISSSRIPIEPAPWRQLDGSQGSQKTAFKPIKHPAKTPDSYPSVINEIEKRVKDLEFRQSGKDLRALKQILEAMQAKGLLETKTEEQSSNFGTQRNYEPKHMIPNQDPKGQRSLQSNHVIPSTARGSDSLRTFESPIVIMKPAKLVKKADIPASSVVPIDRLSGLHKLSSHGSVDSKRSSMNNQTAKDQSSRNNRSDFSISSTDKKSSSRYIRSTQSSTKPRQFSKESTANSVKSSGSISPRLQQKKLELDKRSRQPTPPSDSSKSRRQYNRQSTESSSPGGKLRPKSHNLQRGDDQLSQISNESTTSSHQGDDISIQSDSSIVLEPKIDVEVTSTERPVEISGSQSPSVKASKYSVSGSMQKESNPRLSEDPSLAKLAIIASEHPSPVSVLDTSVYREDAASPVKQIPNNCEGDDGQVSTDNHIEDQWNPADNFSNSMGSGLTSEINRKKLQNIEHLVQKLRQLNSSHDEANTDYIASLCENTNPDHRYISEILLASGLLLSDLGSGLETFHPHQLGYPINPELFFVLEQTKASTLLSKEECNPGKVSHSKPDHGKFHRKLIFDAVNEILVEKLALVGTTTEPWLKSNKLAKKTLNAQKLIKELCLEIEQLEAKKSECSLEGKEAGLKGILWEDVMDHSGGWTDFCGEISGVVLDVERLVFKDLVDEIVIGEAAGLRTKPGRRRQLFAK